MLRKNARKVFLGLKEVTRRLVYQFNITSLMNFLNFVDNQSLRFLIGFFIVNFSLSFGVICNMLPSVL